MSTSIVMHCVGCSAEVSVLWSKRSYPLNPDIVKTWLPSVHDVLADEAPGWQAWDPYTGFTYCPECWTSIDAVGTQEAAPG